MGERGGTADRAAVHRPACGRSRRYVGVSPRYPDPPGWQPAAVPAVPGRSRCRARVVQASRTLRRLASRCRSNQAALVRDADMLRYSELNAQPHSRVRVIAQHATAPRITEQLRAQLVRHQFRLSLVSGRPSVSLPEHLAIVDAVCSPRPRARRARDARPPHQRHRHAARLRRGAPHTGRSPPPNRRRHARTRDRERVTARQPAVNSCCVIAPHHCHPVDLVAQVERRASLRRMQHELKTGADAARPFFCGQFGRPS
jgi:hypothetical protein